MTAGERRPASRLLVLAAVVVIGGLHTAAQIRRGWVPHDEGMIGQTAERVLEGEMPHRDFDELYTGGLTYVNAAAFRMLGMNLLSPRIVIVAFFIATIPVIHAVASRFLPPAGAAAATLLAVAWGLPNYVAALPSWYNLCFALLGVAALLRYIETARAGWLFAAGLCGGLSFLVKLIAIYFAAGAGLFFIYREQALESQRPRCSTGRAYSIVLTAGLAAVVAALLLLIRTRIGPVDVFQFVLPTAALCALLIAREWREPRAPLPIRLAGLGRMALPFVAGFLTPVAAFLVPYVRTGALGAWLTGVFVLPFRRLTFASMNPARPLDLVAAAMSADVLAVALLAGRAVRPVHVTVLVALLGLVLAAAGGDPRIYRVTWYSAALLLPMTVLAGAALLGSRAPRRRDQEMVLLLAVAAWCSLVQFPLSDPIYFCYVAPLLVLAVVSLVGAYGVPSPAMLAVVCVFYLAFAVLRATPGYIFELGQRYAPDVQTHPLNVPRAAGLLIEPPEAAAYQTVLALVGEHGGGSYVWAGPDCPEIYFLSGTRNPTRTLVDFFDDPDGRTERILRAIDERQVKVVAVNGEPSFSERIEPRLAAALASRFPHARAVGRFEVRWRE